MKKILFIITLLALVFNSFIASDVVFASPAKEQATLSFSELGLASDIVMRGPFDVANFRFNLPATWALQDGVEINLVASSYFASNDPNLASLEQPGNYIGALLDVYFNGSLQQSIALKSGENVVYQIPVSVADLVPTSQDGSFEISFFLNASIDCDNEFHHTTVMVSPNSQVGLNYAETAIQHDLRRLPWPIYQARAQVPGSAFVVVPSSPSSDEIQAALTSMAAFGRMTRRNLPLTLITVNELSEDIRQQSDLIFVGKSQSLAPLAEVDLPVPTSNSGFSGIRQNDGVLQQATSPWNERKTVLLVSGNDDQGVVKAAQALSTANLITGDSPSYSIISQINPLALSNVLTVDATPVAATDVTLGDLGYVTQTLSGIGTNYFTFEFIIPPGQQPAESPYLNLEFSHSTLIDSERSEGVAFVNDVIVGGIKLSADNPNSVEFEVKLPPSAFQPGLNTIDIAISLIPRDECSAVTLDGLWVTVSEDSTLHLPLIQSAPADYSSQDLYSYPFPFANDPTLGSTTFVMPQNDLGAWAIAGSLANDLGGLVAGPMILFDAAFDGQVPDEARNQNLIVIGQPKDLSIVSELKESMPAYFEEGSNVAVLETQQVIYYISPDKSLGYLEVFPSPWAENSAVLGIFGTTDEGVSDAAVSLLEPNILDILRGNFATLDGDRPLIVDTRTGLGVGRISPELGSVVTAEDQPIPGTGDADTFNVQDSKSQIFTSLIAVVVLMVIVIVVAIWFRRRNV